VAGAKSSCNIGILTSIKVEVQDWSHDDLDLRNLWGRAP